MKNSNNEKKNSDNHKHYNDDCNCETNCGDNCKCKPDDFQEEDNDIEEEYAGGEIGILNKKIEILETQLKDKSEEVLRKAADLDNYRKRLIKEFDDKVKYANQSVVSDFIVVLDNIELTLSHLEDNTPVKEGIELTIKSFKDTLEKHGVKEIDSNPKTLFDPKYHDALMMDNNNEFENNTITQSLQKGYTLNGRVIRPAKVKVNKI